MVKTRVGVIRGGIGGEYGVSLKTGSSVLKNIPSDKYNTMDVLVTKDGKWHIDGFPTTPDKLASRVDIIFNALHGEYGEDGKVQRALEQFGVPYTGSSVFASAVAMNKALAKYYFKIANIKTPECAMVRRGDDIAVSARRIFRRLNMPYIVKPVSSGSSLGVSIVKDFAGLSRAIDETLMDHTIALVEEYIIGREITCGVIDGMNSEEPYATHPVEIITPAGSEFFDCNVKYNGKTLEVCPANLYRNTSEKIQDYAIKAHTALGMRHYSRSDFILSKRGIFILETNSLPGLTEQSLLPRALKSGGMELPDFLDYILTLALEEK